MADTTLLTFEERGEIVVGRVRAASVLDAVNVSQFGNEVLARVKDTPRINLLLDFQNVDYLSSAVLTELLRIGQAVRDNNGQLRLCALNRDVRKVFEITNLDKVFTIYDKAENAVTRFKRSLNVAAEEDAWDKLTRNT